VVDHGEVEDEVNELPALSFRLLLEPEEIFRRAPHEIDDEKIGGRAEVYSQVRAAVGMKALLARSPVSSLDAIWRETDEGSLMETLPEKHHPGQSALQCLKRRWFPVEEKTPGTDSHRHQ
jgi:hypothetical protein